jgi:hypothetical protein
VLRPRAGRPKLMRVQFIALFGALCWLQPSASARAEQSENRTWRLQNETGRSVLAYGSDNAEDTPITFSCKIRSGRVRVFISETSQRLKPNRSITVTLTAGRVNSRVSGRTRPNEEAGIPSFEGTMSARDSLFTSLSNAQSLSMVVARSRREVPLNSMGNKAKEFAKSCGA